MEDGTTIILLGSFYLSQWNAFRSSDKSDWKLFFGGSLKFKYLERLELWEISYLQRKIIAAGTGAPMCARSDGLLCCVEAGKSQIVPKNTVFFFIKRFKY